MIILVNFKVNLKVNYKIIMSFVKGIKKGKTIELLEEIDILDGQEILIDIQTVNNFWTSLEEFRNSQEFKSVEFENKDFTDLRNKR